MSEKITEKYAVEDTYVYFIEAVGQGKVKIGFSSDVESRVRQLRTGSPYDLEIVGQVNGGADLEQLLHQKFSSYRDDKEWFFFTKEIKEFIAGGYQLEEKDTEVKPKTKRKNECEDCGHIWTPRGREISKACPKCKSEAVVLSSEDDEGFGLWDLLKWGGIILIGYILYNSFFGGS